jgi:hypothetical protein
VDLKAALFRKQQEYKKEKSSSLHVESASASSTVAAAQTAVEKAGRKVSDKVSVRCLKCVLHVFWFYMNLTEFSISNPYQCSQNCQRSC